jgi:hypothetical protein
MWTHAAVSEAEVEQLRDEVKALKAMMQQYVQQQNTLSSEIKDVKQGTCSCCAESKTDSNTEPEFKYQIGR